MKLLDTHQYLRNSLSEKLMKTSGKAELRNHLGLIAKVWEQSTPLEVLYSYHTQQVSH